MHVYIYIYIGPSNRNNGDTRSMLVLSSCIGSYLVPSTRLTLLILMCWFLLIFRIPLNFYVVLAVGILVPFTIVAMMRTGEYFEKILLGLP